MAIDYHRLKNWRFPKLEHSYTEDDSMLYALGIGLGADPVCEGALRFVYERDLQAVPSMAAILAHPGLWMNDPATGVDALRIVHGEQKLSLHGVLPPAGTVVADAQVQAVVDKGAGKGALVIVRREIRNKADGALMATVEQTSFCRGDGGFSAQGQPSDPAAPTPEAMPQREPDLVCELPTRAESALLYRLSSDRNPLHADPETARRAGFPRPILHGMATYGVACHAVLKAVCGYRPEALRMLAARFSSPVFPGETIRTEIWREGRRLRLQARVPERDALVLSHGSAELDA